MRALTRTSPAGHRGLDCSGRQQCMLFRNRIGIRIPIKPSKRDRRCVCACVVSALRLGSGEIFSTSNTVFRRAFCLPQIAPELHRGPSTWFLFEFCRFRAYRLDDMHYLFLGLSFSHGNIDIVPNKLLLACTIRVLYFVNRHFLMIKLQSEQKKTSLV